MAETVVDFLSFSDTASNPVKELGGFRDREWKRALPWLHDAGLALYLLQKLKDTDATDVLPTSELCRLEGNLAANRRRLALLARQFEVLNHRLNRAGVRYAVVKGFSLVPAFCPDASLRHQSDLDYLVDDPSLPLAKTVLEDAGYCLQKSKTNEFVFLMPSAGMPLSADGQYEAASPYAVELRRAFWDTDIHGVCWAEPKFSVDSARTQYWQELAFPALPEEDAFLIQVVHVFNHILTGWVRMSWLYEMGYFLNQRSTDAGLWERIAGRRGGDRLLHEMAVVVTGLSGQLFGSPVPSRFANWAKELRPSTRIWIQHYASTWMFAKNRVDEFSFFSAAPVVLFFHQQYLPDESARRHLMRSRLFPWEQLFRRARSITANSSRTAGSRGPQLRRLLIRLLFHATGGLRFLREIPRWRKLNKSKAAFAGSDNRAVGSSSAESGAENYCCREPVGDSERVVTSLRRTDTFSEDRHGAESSSCKKH